MSYSIFFYSRINFFICKMIKFSKFNNLENLWNLEKLSNTLSIQVGGVQNLEWSNVERPILRNLKITNIKIAKDEFLFDFFIYEFIFYLFF